MKDLTPTRSSLEHIPSLRERTEVRFARGSSPPRSEPVAGPPERPTCPLAVTELIKLLDIDTAGADARDTRKLQPTELRTLGVIEGGELPSIAWAKTSRLSDLDDRLSPTTIVDLADPPARPLHHELAPAVPLLEWEEPDIEITDEADEVGPTLAVGADTIAMRTPISGFLIGIVVGLASVAAAFITLGTLSA